MKCGILDIFDTFWALALNTDDILILSLQDVFGGFFGKKNVAPLKRVGATKNLVFLESWDNLATKNSRYRNHRGKMIFMSHLTIYT